MNNLACSEKEKKTVNEIEKPTPEDYAAFSRELEEHKDDPAYLPLLRLLCYQCSEMMLLESFIADLEETAKKAAEPEKK